MKTLLIVSFLAFMLIVPSGLAADSITKSYATATATSTVSSIPFAGGVLAKTGTCTLVRQKLFLANNFRETTTGLDVELRVKPIRCELK